VTSRPAGCCRFVKGVPAATRRGSLPPPPSRHSTGRTPMILAMYERFGWLQQKALADPFAKRYEQAAKGVLVVLAALVFMVFAAFLIAYPSIAKRPAKPGDPTWTNSVILAQITIGLMVLGAGSVLGLLFYSIRTSNPQPDWHFFPSLWSPRRKQGMALVSGASTFLGLGIASALLILIVAASGPQWLVGTVSVVLVSITMWGSLVVGLRYYQDLCSGDGQTELASALKSQAGQLDEALQTAAAQFESVRGELAQHEKTLDALREEVRKNREAVAASREVAKAQETLERHGRFRRQQIVFLLLGALLGALLGMIFGVVVDPAGIREHLPQWLTLFD
jgi:hypothetical protein